MLRGEATEQVWALEHPPVVTTGRRRVEGLPSAVWLAEHGVDFEITERGGLATYHGPGQLVLYFLMNLRGRKMGVKRFVGAMEHGVTDWLSQKGVEARNGTDARGVFVEGKKICAVGIHVRRGVTLHGLALNLNMDLAPFGWFKPCGLDEGVTHLSAHMETAPTPVEAWDEVSESVLQKLIDMPQPGR
jgi:lipoyl(octanoyl) transferase